MSNPKIYEYGKSTRFGQPNGNKPNPGGLVGGGKTFRQRIAELVFLNEDELKAYAQNVSNPAVCRKAAVLLARMENISDLAKTADIIESKPVTFVESQNDCEIKITEV